MNFETSRLDKYIKRVFGNIPQSIIEKAIRNKDILLNGIKPKASSRVRNVDDIFIHPSIIKLFQQISQNNTDNTKINCASYIDQFRQMTIYEDNNLLILNKPSGMAVQLGSRTNIALDIIAKEYDQELRLVHRIDKETSGITIMAKNIITARYMFELFKNKQVKKKYIALLSGKLSNKSGMINIPLLKTKDKVIIDYKHGKEAITQYRVIQNVNGISLIEAFPLTGRTHQIRAHMASINAPILGDRKYGGKVSKYLFLHAYEVQFKDPYNHKLINIKAPLPDYYPNNFKI